MKEHDKNFNLIYYLNKSYWKQFIYDSLKFEWFWLYAGYQRWSEGWLHINPSNQTTSNILEFF